MRNKIWTIWAKALGEKSHPDKKYADAIALLRTMIFLTYFLTNAFIIAGVIRHWDDGKPSEMLMNNGKEARFIR